MNSVEPSVLIIWHSRTGASEALAQAAAEGAGGAAMLRAADRVQAAEMLAAAAYIFV